jgi:hypothetical protein
LHKSQICGTVKPKSKSERRRKNADKFLRRYDNCIASGFTPSAKGERSAGRLWRLVVFPGRGRRKHTAARKKGWWSPGLFVVSSVVGGQPPPKPGLTPEQIQELLSRPPGVHSLLSSKTTPPKDGSYLYLYVAPHRGILHWWYSQVTGIIRGKHRSQGDLPLVYATTKTGQDSLKASVGVMLIRQLITDKDSYKAIDRVSKEGEIKRREERLRKLKDDIRWVEEFIVWLYRWATKLVGEDNAWDSTYKFLLEYYPAIHSPKAYFLKSKPHQDKFPQKGKAIAGEEFTGERFVQPVS